MPAPSKLMKNPERAVSATVIWIFPQLQILQPSCWYFLSWMMDNIYIRTDPAGNIKADKEKSTEKIDGAVASIMELDRAIRCGNNTGASVYDDRGILFI